MVNKKHIDIFSNTECLSLEAIQAYAANKLGTQERLQIEKHLVDCAICNDAVEGYSLITIGSAINKRVDKINKRIDVLTAKSYVPLWKKEYFSYAAAVVGILLVCSMLYVSIKSSVNTDRLISQDINNPLEQKTDKEEAKQEPGSESKGMVGNINAKTDDNPEDPSLTLKEKDNASSVKGTKAQEDIAANVLLKEEGISFEDEEELEIALNDVDNGSNALFSPDETRIAPIPEISDENNLLEERDLTETITTQSDNQPNGENTNREENQQIVLSEAKSSGKTMKAARSMASVGAQASNNNIEYDKVFPTEAYSAMVEESDEPIVSSIVEVAPMFQGGEEKLAEYLTTNVRYSDSAKAKKIEGIVYTSFTVNEDSSISNAKILKSLESSCDKEALRVINNMPNWIPGHIGGKRVPMQYNLPIKFNLSETK